MTAHHWFEVRNGLVPPAEGREPASFGAVAARAILPYAGGLRLVVSFLDDDGGFGLGLADEILRADPGSAVSRCRVTVAREDGAGKPKIPTRVQRESDDLARTVVAAMPALAHPSDALALIEPASAGRTIHRILLACACADTAVLDEVAMESFSRVPALHELRGVALSKIRWT